MRSQVYSLLVDNNPGVLSRIAGLFGRRGYSIDSITAGMTADPRFTRITVVSSGDELILSQIEKQLRKLEDVVDIKMLKENESVCRELIMVKLRADASQRGEIISVADIFRAKIVDVEEDCLMIELTGTKSKLEAFLNLLVTQMQYQDPLNPSDNTEYMSQLAQYSALEAQLNISDTLDKGNNLNLVGKYVIMNTTDSSGKQAMISGLVEYATVKDGDVYLSVNNTYYPAEDLDSVIDYDYYLYLKQHANSDGTINKDDNTSGSTNGTDNVGGKTDDLDKTDAADKTKEA